MPSTRFVRKWREFAHPSGISTFRPILPILVRGEQGFVERDFLLDSGADLSMAPRELCKQIGLNWQAGEPTEIRGISRRKNCRVQGRVHEVAILVTDAGVLLRIPMVFAWGNAPYVLGREGFFDIFNISFEKPKLRTVFQLTEQY
jgi:hypothetical protein